MIPMQLDRATASDMAWLVQHMLAGAAAGTAEHLAMYPVDTIKTRMQALSHPGQHVSVFQLSMPIFHDTCRCPSELCKCVQ